MKKYAVTLLSFALVIMMTTAAFAQTSAARLEGTVKDSSGSAIPNAKVTAVEAETGNKSETTSGAQGVFVFPSLPGGTYSLSVESTGFRKSVTTGISLLVGQVVNQNITLEVGAVSESVTVLATVQGVQTSDSTVGRNVTLNDVATLPQLARTPITLAIYQPGVQLASGDTSFSHINGLRQGSNNSSLDGIDANDSVVPRLGLSLTANNTDSIEEVRLITSGGKAEYGRDAGGQVELITRSGTNAFHGGAFDYLRNTDLNANDFFNNASTPTVARPVLIQNIFGGSVGGPIKKQKAFFFFNTQLRRTTQQFVTNRTVLTDTAKQGIYRWVAPCAGQTPTASNPNPCNLPIQSLNIVAEDPRHLGIDPTVNALIKQLPAPNNSTVGDGFNTLGYQFNAPSGGQENQITAKFDYTISSKQHAFFRYSRQTNFSFDALNSAQQTYPGQPSGTQGGIRWGVAGGHDWTITSHLINEFRYGYQSATTDFLRVRPATGPELLPNLYTNPVFTGFTQGRNSPVNQFTDNLSWVKGTHTFKTGFISQWTDQFGYNYANTTPNVSLAVSNGATVPAALEPGGGSATVISSSDKTRFDQLYNDLLGRISSVQLTYQSDLTAFKPAGTVPVRNYLLREYGAFIQDDWKIKPNLTLNYGLRWELSMPPVERDGLQGNLDQAAQIAGMLYQSNNTAIVKTSKWYNADWNNFAPRIGFSWDPFKEGKTAIRGAYGIFYDRQVGAAVSLADGQTPGFSQSATTLPNVSGTTDVRVSDGLTGLTPPIPSAPILQQPAIGNRSVQPAIFNANLATGYVQHISLNIQHEFWKNTIIDVGYVGTRGIKLFMDRDANQLRIGGDFLTSFNQLAAFYDGGKNDGPALPASNTLVRLYGTPAAAVSGIGATALTQGQVYSAASTVDSSTALKAKYPSLGLSPYYLSNYPQYGLTIVGTNDGRSYYNSLQVTLRHNVGAFKFTGNYTYSKSMDNWNAEGNGFTSTSIIDNYNLGLNRARSDFDQPHSFNFNSVYTLPFGKGHRFGSNWNHFMDSLLGGWDLGFVGLWHSGQPFSITSGRATGPNSISYIVLPDGFDRNSADVNRQGGGVFVFSPDQIKAIDNQALAQGTAGSPFPVAGSIGNGGRNTFRGPRDFNIDASLVKRFKITENTALSFRAEFYNLFNDTNFANPVAGNLSANSATFGKVTATVTSSSFPSYRVGQVALRFDF